MHYVKDLVFFNKTGTNYGFKYDPDSEKWSGSIIIDPVSVGLFETEKIYVMQKYVILEHVDTIASDSVEYVYGYPATTLPQNAQTPASNDYYEFRWEEDIKEVDEIQMFGFDTSVCPPEDTSSLRYQDYNCPDIEYMDTVRIENLRFNPVEFWQTLVDPQTHEVTEVMYKKNAEWRSQAAAVNLCFCNSNDEYMTFRRDLKLYYVIPGQNNAACTEYHIGTFTVYAKSIEEDERLTTMCTNLGYDINNVDFSIFQDSDIKEQLVDHELLNQKRKEIIMEGHNIYSYIGSYKSLINAIRFFGYDNVSIREWWKNVDVTSENYGKHFSATNYSLSNHEVVHDSTAVTLPSKKFRKTGKLSLAYNINTLQQVHSSNIYDDEYFPAPNSYYGHEYPNTYENFTYTIEEAVIKLYGLKRKLEKEFLPLNTRIIDIIGEADSFHVSTVRHTMTQNTLFCNASGAKNNFSVLGSPNGCFYIEDLRPFGIHTNTLPAGSGIVGELRQSAPEFIPASSNHQSLYDSNLTNVVEFGAQGLQNYNSNWNETDHEQVVVTTGFQGLQGLQGLQGNSVHPPYEMTGNSLFGVSGAMFPETQVDPNNTNLPQYENTPWIYYVLANNTNYGNYYLAEFSDYYPNLVNTALEANDFETDSNTCLPDNENIPVGALVELKVDENDVTWNELLVSWDYVQTVTWNALNMYAANISRVEWVIHKDADINPGFDTTICGLVSAGYSDIGIVLPYVGDYDVTMKLYDWNNNVSIIKKEAAITVCPKEVEFTGWCRMKTKTLDWTAERSWESLSCIWDFPYANNMSWNELRSATYTAMDRASFLGEYEGTTDLDESVLIYNFANNGPGVLEDNRGAYIWNNLDVAWQDMDHLWWNAMCITGDIPCYFELGYFDTSGNPVDSPEAVGAGVSDSLAGKWLELVNQNNQYAAFRFPTSYSGNLNYMADIVRQLNESTNPVISQFHYSYIWDYDSSHTASPYELEIPDGFMIIGVSKNHGKTGDMKHVGVVSSQYHANVGPGNILNIHTDLDNHQLRFSTNSVECNPNWNDCVCINNVTRIPAYTDINFNYTNCKIWGKKNPIWKLTNINTVTTFTSTNKHYHRLFKEKGCWEVSLTLNDTNGNTYSTARNMFIID